MNAKKFDCHSTLNHLGPSECINHKFVFHFTVNVGHEVCKNFQGGFFFFAFVA